MIRHTILIVLIILVSVSVLLAEGSGVTALYSDDESDFAGVMAVSSGLVVAFSMVYDIATAGRSVDKYNHSHGFTDLRLTPAYLASHTAPGVMLTLSF